jgi:hypothetical protein
MECAELCDIWLVRRKLEVSSGRQCKLYLRWFY